MKKEYFDYLDILMSKDIRVYGIFCGLGWPRIDQLQKVHKDRVINTEASEQTALDIAVGLAYDNKIPFVYTITPFLLRGYETIRTYIDHERLHVVLVGVGRGHEYGAGDGFSHDAEDIKEVLSPLHNVAQYYPDTVYDMRKYMDFMVETNNPFFLNISR